MSGAIDHQAILRIFAPSAVKIYCSGRQGMQPKVRKVDLRTLHQFQIVFLQFFHEALNRSLQFLGTFNFYPSPIRK